MASKFKPLKQSRLGVGHSPLDKPIQLRTLKHFEDLLVIAHSRPQVYVPVSCSSKFRKWAGECARCVFLLPHNRSASAPLADCYLTVLNKTRTANRQGSSWTKIVHDVSDPHYLFALLSAFVIKWWRLGNPENANGNLIGLAGAQSPSTKTLRTGHCWHETFGTRPVALYVVPSVVTVIQKLTKIQISFVTMERDFISGSGCAECT